MQGREGWNAIAKAAAKNVAAYKIERRLSALQLCKELLDGELNATSLLGWDNCPQDVDNEYKAFIVGSLYMLLMPKERRRRLAAYFTPPSLCQIVIDRAEAYGLNLRSDRIIDPACGGAAFLLPLARRMICKKASSTDIASRLVGIEIDPGLAALSRLLLKQMFPSNGLKAGQIEKMIIRSNALKNISERKFDAVLANPPYGRVFRASEALYARWSHVISSGHVNTYVLFIAAALEMVRSGGLVAIVVPTSFLSGPSFEAIRSHMLQQASVLELAFIEKRSEEFIDVTQDTCILLLRKQSFEDISAFQANCLSIKEDGTVVELGTMDIPARVQTQSAA